MLRTSVLALGALVSGCATRTVERASAAGAALRSKLPNANRPLPPLPADPAAGIDGLPRLITPTPEFFRIDTANDVPAVNARAWTLRIDGMVARPLELDYQSLLERDIIEVDAALACVSNEVGGFLVGNARWRGVRLAELVADAAPLARADQVLGHSTDGFTAGFPVSALWDRDAILALGMNGEVLTAEHGYPARIIVPGLYGYVSAVKWVTRIELTRFDEQVGYWVPRGWSQFAPVKLASRIDTPRNGSAVPTGPTAIGGVAWAGMSGIQQVQVQIDDGPWRDAELGPQLSSTSWRQWWLPWDVTPGKHTLTVRARDDEGNVQSARQVPPDPNGAEGLHTISINAE